ncbi:MAG: M3 family oligoendopeptidase, partial [Candidatus Hinthialibacter sp.]
QAYQKLCGAMTVEFDGREQTMPQMAKYQEETDRARRREAWELTANRRLQDRASMDDIFNQLVQRRRQMARNAGCDTFVDYAFRMYHRFDYTPADCLRFHETVESCIMPVVHANDERRREVMNLDALRPWDMAVDPLGRPPLRPFEEASELAEKVERILRHIEPELAEQFWMMHQNGELDLESRKGKAPGGYQYTLDEVRRPFIFMNAAGLHRDVETLLHESGHAFHALACRNDPLLPYRESPIEFAEVASMAMELFGARYYEEFYSAADAARARRRHLESVIDVLAWIARIDAFQHWIYTHPAHTAQERTAYWLELDERFGARLDWSGCEAVRESLWQRQLHLFCHPFYYIEYGIAQLGALQLWRIFQQDEAEAVRGYRRALALGGAKPLPQLFEAAGARFDFSQ